MKISNNLRSVSVEHELRIYVKQTLVCQHEGATDKHCCNRIRSRFLKIRRTQSSEQRLLKKDGL